MNRKRTQTNKKLTQEDTEETPSKRSRLENKTQNKENESHPNLQSQTSGNNPSLEMESIAQNSQRTVVLRNMQSDIATELKSGKIKKIVIKNFMCHRNFEVNLNPNVNVFVGLNGSGKSAILTAIAVGLGSKAQATARSTNLKDLVRRGETTATIEITLTNDGIDAYDEDVYGREIVIVRTINGNTGASQYKIKSENGRKIIATTRQDLSRLTLCMNIQVENPVLILNQDAARSFLKECDPKKLYLFFMKATQIEAIIEKLNSTLKIAVTLKNNLEIMDKRVRQDETEINDLSGKLTRLQSAQVLRQRISNLQNEIEWFHIIAREKELLKAQRELAQSQADVKKIEDFLKNQSKFEKEAKDLICQLGASFGELQKEIEKHSASYEKARAEHEVEYNKEKEGASKLESYKKKVVLLEQGIQEIKADIAECENNPDNVNNMRQENEAKIEDYVNKRNETMKILDNAKRDHAMFIENLNATKEKYNDINGKFQREHNQFQKLTATIDQYRKSGKDQMMAYGPSMSALLKDVEQLVRQRKFSAPPRGPIGRYVEVPDRKYRLGVENILDRTLTAFIVNSDQDRIVLKRALSKYNDLRNLSIICCKFQDRVYDVNKGKAEINHDDGVLLFDVIKVDDPVVMNCLIDQKMIERIVLVDKTENAINLTQHERQVPRNLLKVVLLDPFSEYYPAPNYRTYSLRQNPARFIQANLKDLIAGVEEQKQAVQTRIISLKAASGQVQQQIRDQDKLVNDKKKIMRELQKRIQTYDRDLEELRSIEYPEQGNVELKREILAEEEKKLEYAKKKVSEMSDKQNVLKEISTNFKKKVDEAQKEHEKTREKMSKAKEMIEKTQLEMNDMKNDISNKSNQLLMMKATEAENASKVSMLQGEVQNMMQQAPGTRVECSRGVEEIKMEIKSIEKKIERIESSHENIDDIAKLLDDKKNSLEDHKKITDGLKQIQITLSNMRDQRFHYVRKLRQHMILRVRHKFAQLMELRNYAAQMDVDLKEKTLELKVIPRDSNIEGAVSNTKSLSGGERSYSTVSFLISLWSCVDHPFYFLDEYDVFSDEYNRHIMTSLLFNEALKNPSKQYGFLTPQDFSNIQATEKITIHKLQDPDRKQ